MKAFEIEANRKKKQPSIGFSNLDNVFSTPIKDRCNH